MRKRAILEEMGYENSVIFDNPDFDNAIIGVCEDGAVAYNYELMVQHLVDKDDMTEEEAIDFIDYNTLRALPYFPSPKPVIIYSLWEE